MIIFPIIIAILTGILAFVIIHFNEKEMYYIGQISSLKLKLRIKNKLEEVLSKKLRRLKNKDKEVEI